MIIKEEGYKVQQLKSQGKYTIDKVTESNGEIFYDVYDEEQNLQNVFRTLTDARKWIKLMS